MTICIDPNFRKCVTYLFVDVHDKDSCEVHRIPRATAFFVNYPILDGKCYVIYAVTARHVIRKSREYGSLYIRWNLTNGKIAELPSPQDNWYEHPTTDVAICPTIFPVNGDVKSIPFAMLASPKMIADYKVVEGEEIFFTGMFQSFPGRDRMQPVSRFGNISLMPYEKIDLRDSPEDAPYLAEAYLVEAKSWGGHSGSPAFLYLNNPNRFPGQIVISGGIPNIVLLGLVSSHYEIPQDVKFIGDVLGSGTVNINAGLAAVIPAHYISELLLDDELIEQRKKIEEAIKDKVTTLIPDMAESKPVLTQKEFEDLSKKISRPLNSDDPTKKGK